jgi:hypothetical protein
MFPFRHARNVDSTTGAGWVTREANEWGAHATFVDDTGGFGSGWIDQMRALGQAPIGIHFASEASNKARYANMRTEMYFGFVEWIKRGGALPDCPELLAALTQTTIPSRATGSSLSRRMTSKRSSAIRRTKRTRRRFPSPIRSRLRITDRATTDKWSLSTIRIANWTKIAAYPTLTVTIRIKRAGS